MTSTQPEAGWALARPAARSGAELASLAARARRHGPAAALLALTGLLYLWSLGRIGYGNDFYAAAVKAGTQSWKAFFFGSLDASNFITVDKPPASLWVMELSGRLFGFSSWSLLVPQALEGVAAVALLYATVRRWFSTPAALLSGAILALTPVAALMFRFDNPDALLVLLLVGAAYATVRALEHASVRWLSLAGALIGFGFLTKMLQAFLVLPALALVYLVAAPTSPLRRVRHLLVAGVALVAAGGWWVAAVELTPAADRPYVGGSTGNSILNLIWGYNGVGRISGGAGGGGGANFSGRAGILRLFNSELGGQISWLIPAALLALGAGAWVTLRRPRTDRTRAALVLWGTWLVVGGLVYSFMTGIIHPYYSNTLAPALAVLVGVGATLAWGARRSLAAAAVLAGIVLATAGWSYALLDRTPSWHPWLRDAVLVAGIAAAAGLVAARNRRLGPWLAVPLAAAALFAGLGGSAAYTVDTVGTIQDGSTPSAGPAVSGAGAGGFPGGGAPSFTGASRSGPPGGTRPTGTMPTGTMPTGGRPSGVPRAGVGFGGSRGGGGAASVSAALAKLIAASGSSYEWAAATGSSMTAAPLELATGKAVMAIGGFNGGDQAIGLARFEQLVAQGKIHYYVGSSGGTGGGPGGRSGGDATAIASWVASHFSATTVGGTTVYDLSS